MNEKKQNQITEFKAWCILNDINYRELSNGHFHIMNGDTGKLSAQIWATSERMIDDQGKHHLGMATIRSRLVTASAEEHIGVVLRTELRQRFLDDYKNALTQDFPKVLVVAVRLPTGAIEVITNHDKILVKMQYYIDSYNEAFQLKANTDVQITGYMLV